jgi:hypothetical protein
MGANHSKNLNTQEISLTSTTKMTLRATALAAFTLVSASAFADFDANIEFDNTYGNNGRGLSQGGRVELNASKKMGSQYFIAGKASYLALKSGSVATDDMWVQLGSQTFDVKLGRFEATNLFQTPGDTIIEVAGSGTVITNQGAPYSGPYAANALRGRTGSNVFQGAATLQLGGGLSFELGVVETKNQVGQANAGTAKGLRPILSYANGPLHVAAGAEAIKYSNGRKETGYGLTGDYDFGGFKLTANLVSGKSDLGYKQSAYGLIAQMGGFTAGLLASAREMPTGTADFKDTTFYTSYAIPFFDIKGATVTPALSVSKGGGSNTAEDSIGARVRVNYAF